MLAWYVSTIMCAIVVLSLKATYLLTYTSKPLRHLAPSRVLGTIAVGSIAWHVVSIDQLDLGLYVHGLSQAVGCLANSASRSLQANKQTGVYVPLSVFITCAMLTCDYLQQIIRVTFYKKLCYGRGTAQSACHYRTKLAIDEWPWHTPKVITVAAVKLCTAYHFLCVDCCFNVYI